MVMSCFVLVLYTVHHCWCCFAMQCREQCRSYFWERSAEILVCFDARVGKDPRKLSERVWERVCDRGGVWVSECESVCERVCLWEWVIERVSKRVHVKGERRRQQWGETEKSRTPLLRGGKKHFENPSQVKFCEPPTRFRGLISTGSQVSLVCKVFGLSILLSFRLLVFLAQDRPFSEDILTFCKPGESLNNRKKELDPGRCQDSGRSETCWSKQKTSPPR